MLDRHVHIHIAGLVFSDDEATALIQYEGGPCAVIAPVQAYLLKRILFSPTAKDSITDVTGNKKIGQAPRRKPCVV